jgi:uncharacterized protein YfaT (DUF1175 family)
MATVVTHGQHEYRRQGGEIHRRPVEREHLKPVDAAWLVLNGTQRQYEVPDIVLQNLNSGLEQNLHFD